MKPATAKLPTLSAELSAAISAAESSLSEYARLQSLGAELEANHEQHLASRAQLADRLAELEVDLALAGEDAGRALSREIDRTRSELLDMDAELGRFERQKQGIGLKLREVDAAIETASASLRSAAEEFRKATVLAFEVELREAVRGLVGVLHRGHALNAAFAGGISYALSDIKIPSPVWGRPPLLNGATLAVDGEVRKLDVAWREDATASAVHDVCRPVKQIADRLAPHSARIARERDKGRAAANERSRNACPAARHSTLPAKTAAEPVSPPARFVPNSWTGERTQPQATEANPAAHVGAAAMRDQLGLT